MEEKKSYVYRHLKPNGEVFYVGVGTDSNFQRSKSKRNRNEFWRYIVDKYGYEIQILKQNISKKEAEEVEILLVSWYGRRDLGLGTLCNLTDGGGGTIGHTHTKEYCEMMSELRRGDKNPFYGKNHSKESCKKISDALKGNKHPNYGNKYSPERIREMRILSTGKITPEHVKEKQKASCLKTGHPNDKKVIDTETLEVYTTISSTARIYGYNRNVLKDYLNGKRPNKTILMFLSEYIKQNPNFKHE